MTLINLASPHDAFVDIRMSVEAAQYLSEVMHDEWVSKNDRGAKQIYDALKGI